MKEQKIADGIVYIGVNDRTIDLFESQYVVPNGVSYNSYCILDEKIAIMDTVDYRMSGEWLMNLDAVLQGKVPDYLIISHLEPDHAGTIAEFVAQYPQVTLVGNAKTFAMLPNFFDLKDQPKLTVAEGDTLSLGAHTLQFFMAPMVHWPEVMVEYEQKEKILFSADGFGKFGALDTEEPWDEEARRYYYNIVGKYGMAEAVANAFQYDRMVLAAASYDGGLFPPMEEFLLHLKAKSFQNRTVALIENGSWAPCAKKCMTNLLNEMKKITVLEQTVTIRSTVKPETESQLQALAEAIRKA